MELKWLEDFVELAQTGSFSRAADERNITQPAFSRRIRALENWLGATLVDRSSYPVTLTDMGRQFLPSAEEIIRSATGVRNDFRLLNRSSGPAIRIVTLHTLASTVLPDAVSALLAREPGARVSISASIQGIEEHFDALTGGTADILITYGHLGIIEKAVSEGSMEWLTLRHEQFILVATPDRAEEWGERPLTKGRSGLPFLSYSNYSFSEKLVMPVARRYARQLRIVYEDSLAESLRAMALRGLGLAWLPKSLVRDDLDKKRLVVLEDESLRIGYEIRAYKAQRNKNATAALAWEVLKSLSVQR